jgi:hypothetical protein
MDEPQFPESDRRRSARTLAGALALLAVLSLASVVLAARSVTRGPGEGSWVLAFAAGVACALSLASVALEWRRTHSAETVSLFAIVLSLGVAVSLLTLELWWLSLTQGVVAVTAALLLARRFIVRDESRHRVTSH